MFGLGRRKKAEAEAAEHQDAIANEGRTLGITNWKNMIPVIACGAGLFSDGYINNVCLLRLFSPHSKVNYTLAQARPPISVACSDTETEIKRETNKKPGNRSSAPSSPS